MVSVGDHFRSISYSRQTLTCFDNQPVDPVSCDMFLSDVGRLLAYLVGRSLSFTVNRHVADFLLVFSESSAVGSVALSFRSNENFENHGGSLLWALLIVRRTEPGCQKRFSVTV